MKTIEEALKLLADSEIINEEINLNKKYQGIFRAQGETVMSEAYNIKDLNFTFIDDEEEDE